MEISKGSYQSFLDGDDDGIIPIIRDYKDGLILYLNTFTGSTERSEELAEEVFVKLILKKPHFRGESSFKTWLYSVARNIAFDYLRRKTKSNEISLEETVDMVSDEDIEREYLRSEQRIVLNKAMGKLKKEYYGVPAIEQVHPIGRAFNQKRYNISVLCRFYFYIIFSIA